MFGFKKKIVQKPVEESTLIKDLCGLGDSPKEEEVKKDIFQTVLENQETMEREIQAEEGSFDPIALEKAWLGNCEIILHHIVAGVCVIKSRGFKRTMGRMVSDVQKVVVHRLGEAAKGADTLKKFDPELYSKAIENMTKAEEELNNVTHLH